MRNIDRSLIFLLTILCIGGLSGSIPFLLSPDGSALGMSTDLLVHSPVGNYFWPGVFLLLVMVIWPLKNIYGIVRKKPWTATAIYTLGIVTMVWIVYETITIRTFSPLQPFIFVIGFGLVIGGLKKHKSELSARFNKSSNKTNL